MWPGPTAYPDFSYSLTTEYWTKQVHVIHVNIFESYNSDDDDDDDDDDGIHIYANAVWHYIPTCTAILNYFCEYQLDMFKTL